MLDVLQRNVEGMANKTLRITSISHLPKSPAIYAMYGGNAGNKYVAYVGIADKLKRRIIQHMVSRDSSISTGTSAVGLNPDYVSELRWWEHTSFSDRNALIAAELVAFQILDPALRSRGRPQRKAQEIYNDKEFYMEMKSLFKNEPKGILIVSNLQSATDRIERLENKIAFLEEQIRQLQKA